MGAHAAFLLLVSFYVLIVPVLSAINNTTRNAADCSCGYYDADTQELFTESLIVYFNETTNLPVDGFVEQSYENDYQKGWNTQYRQGASPTNLKLANSTAISSESNVGLGNSSSSASLSASLQLFIEKSTPQHLVMGSGLQTIRQDIQYGSFRSLMRSAGQWQGGSAMSMIVEFNETQSIAMNMMNTEMPSTAWISTLMHEEFASRSYGINYTVIGNHSEIYGTPSPWDYTELRMDWTSKEVNYWIGNNLTRTISKKGDEPFPVTPCPVYLKHWSTGDFFSMQGPPPNRSVASVGWARLFFNSSLMSNDDHKSFDDRCKVSNACAMADTSLRGASEYAAEAALVWKPMPLRQGRRLAAVGIASVAISVSTFLLLNALLKRAPWKKVKIVKERKQSRFSNDSTEGLTSEQATLAPSSGIFSPGQSTVVSANMTPSNRTRRGSVASVEEFNLGDLAKQRISQFSARFDNEDGDFEERRVQHDRDEAYFRLDGSPIDPNFDLDSGEDKGKEPVIMTARNEVLRKSKEPVIITTVSRSTNSLEEKEKEPVVTTIAIPYSSRPTSSVVEKGKEDVVTTVPAHAPLSIGAGATKLPAAKQRVDYLAGLVALSSLLVTAIHFGLTFMPAVIDPGADVHYESEVWARKTINPFLLNLIWIGPFLMTSTRFLASSYLRNGDLRPMAEKVVGRTFRLLIPITAIVLLEYFLMDCGATKWLMYLPSITWSTWPFTVGYTNFSTFLSEILELAYLIPNAAPQITFNYCTGVLWTIPVQLQNSWLVLLGVIVIREIKTPWKRFGYYTFCILNHWYALSWGSYFWFGLMLADLDITYKYRKWLYARAFIYYPLIFLCFILGFGGLGMDILPQWTTLNYSINEYGIHPDSQTGLPISQTVNAGYPQYYLPKLNGLVFSVGFQALVELSPVAQKILSFKLFVYVFPHIFTIYLIHGFVFWSLGAWACVHLAAYGVPYWANMLIVAIVCYAAIGLSLPLLTPVVETLGKSITSVIWHNAYEKPTRLLPTMYPFSGDLFLSQLEEPEVTVKDEKYHEKTEADIS